MCVTVFVCVCVAAANLSLTQHKKATRRGQQRKRETGWGGREGYAPPAVRIINDECLRRQRNGVECRAVAPPAPLLLAKVAI